MSWTNIVSGQSGSGGQYPPPMTLIAISALIGQMQAAQMPVKQPVATDVVFVSDATGIEQETLASIVALAAAGAATQVATYSALPPSPKGFYVVLADETKGGGTILYLFFGAHRGWIAMNVET